MNDRISAGISIISRLCFFHCSSLPVNFSFPSVNISHLRLSPLNPMLGGQVGDATYEITHSELFKFFETHSIQNEQHSLLSTLYTQRIVCFRSSPLSSAP